MIKIAIPKPSMLLECWSAVSPYIKMAIDESHGELSMDAIIEGIEKGEILIATVFDDTKLIAVCSYQQFTFDSGKRVIQILGAGGSEVDSWFEQIDGIANELAKAYNCTEIYINGRKGWERKMKHLGYTHAHTIISREVS